MFKIHCVTSWRELRTTDENTAGKMAFLPQMRNRSFRARHREITYRKVENKSFSKLKTEKHDHIMAFFEAMRSIEKHYTSIRDDGDLGWNFDKTPIDTTKSHTRKLSLLLHPIKEDF